MSGSSVEILFNSFSLFFSSPWPFKRRPYNFLKSVNAARSAPVTSTARIFLEHGGFRVWVAYLVYQPGTANHQGNQSLRGLLTELDNLSPEEKQQLAKRLAAVPPHHTVESQIREMEVMAQPTDQPMATSVPSKRPRKFLA